MTKQNTTQNLWKFTAISAPIIALLLVIVIVANYLMLVTFEPIISTFFSTTAPSSATRNEGEALATQIEEESIVLTKNDGNVLPLDKSTVNKVNVFGWVSANWIQAGSGSGRTTTSKGALSVETDLLKALTDCGIEYNTALADMYVAYQPGNPYFTYNNNMGSLKTYNTEFCRLYEPSISNDKNFYTDSLLQEALAYSDTALVVLGRYTGESNDAPMKQVKARGTTVLGEDETRTYLDISTEEEELLNYVGKNFNNVVVVINSANAMNLSVLDKIDGLDSCIIVGYTGQNAANAIPHVLFEDPTDPEWKQVTPSGRTVDTYVRDFSTTASFVNSGENGVSAYTDTDSSLYPIGITNENVSKTDKYQYVSYLDYQEGIYVGYKWFETADTENFWTSQAAKNTWNASCYEDVVQYPFGYGLSYTNFEWTVVGGLKEKLLSNGDIQYTLVVSVKNVGQYPGQDVVQLYYTPPYTSGGIEKASVNLCAFAKTISVLKPGEIDDVTLTFKRSDMASYDCYDANNNGFAGYELEKGDYVISLRNNAHVVATDKMTDGSNALYTIKLENDIQLETDPTTGAVVSNLFTGDNAVDGISVDGSQESVAVKYMTRADFENSFPFEKVAARNMTQACKNANLYTETDVETYTNTFNAANANAQMPTVGSTATKYKLFDGLFSLSDVGIQLAIDYDNSLWEDVLNQMTESELKKLVLHGYTHEEAISSIGKLRTTCYDGPNQVGSYNASNCGTGFPCTATAAQSWNVQLIYSQGLAMGAEARSMNINGLYAPGINIHRSAFGGRNYEYFSEDSYLSGVLCTQYVSGVKNMGVYTYIKHLIAYDQESMRDSIYVWMTEQALREVYLKPFKIAIDNGATGIMSSYGRLGAVWTGGSYALLTSLLRDEWNFKGAVITDYADHQTFMNGDQMVRAGGDLWMDGFLNNGSFKQETTSVAFYTALRTAAKHIIFMYADTLLTNYLYDPSQDSIQITTHEDNKKISWKVWVCIADGVALAGHGIWTTFAILKPIKAKKTQVAAQDSENKQE